jgi:ABC-type multidrug transport system fused ATPase/permease subunit
MGQGGEGGQAFEGGQAMIRMLRRYLQPYAWPIAGVLVLLLVQAIGNLYLPTLNGDIINEGVSKGDTDYILRIGGLMLVVSLALGAASGSRRSSRSSATSSSRG